MSDYSKLITTLLGENSFLGIDHLRPFISKFVLRKTGSTKNGVVAISGIDYEIFEKFLSEYKIYPSKKLKEIIKHLCKCDEFAVDLKDIGGFISFYFQEKNDNEFIPKSYNDTLPAGALKDGFKITYDINEDRIVYMKVYCLFREDLLSSKKDDFRNFGFSIDENEKISLVTTQKCVHKIVRNIEKADDNIKTEYEELSKLGFKANIAATREETEQSYLYIMKSV